MPSAGVLHPIGAVFGRLRLGAEFGFGVLSVHEVRTDPRTNVDLAYLSYYNAGARVVKLSHKHGIREVGFFIDEGGNHFWGIYPHRLGKSQGQPLLLYSDRDRGLYILRYTGN